MTKAFIVKYQALKSREMLSTLKLFRKINGRTTKNAKPVKKTATQVIHISTLFMYFHPEQPQIIRRMTLNEQMNAIMSQSKNLPSCSATSACPGCRFFSLSLVCAKPPGGFSPAWNVTVAISAATTISVCRASLCSSCSCNGDSWDEVRYCHNRSAQSSCLLSLSSCCGVDLPPAARTMFSKVESLGSVCDSGSKSRTVEPLQFVALMSAHGLSRKYFIVCKIKNYFVFKASS